MNRQLKSFAAAMVEAAILLLMVTISIMIVATYGAEVRAMISRAIGR